jgi:Tfp pilus assembly protein PilF
MAERIPTRGPFERGGTIREPRVVNKRSTGIGPLLWAGLASWLALACGTAPSVPPSVARPDLAASLVLLGEQALAAGHLAAAEDRFTRALEADPAAAAAHLGLGRTALAQGDLVSAQDHFARVLGDAPSAVDAQIGLASVARRQGLAAQASEHLVRALEADPWRAEAHAELAALTGPAPRTPADLGEVLARARAHPYDVAAALAAGSALAGAGRKAEAVSWLESTLWLADLDPKAARLSLALLARLDPAWRERRVVLVHSYADESIRAHPGWEFRLRLAWLGASRALGPLLGVRFLPASLQGFASREASGSLDAIDAAFRAQTTRVPGEGILAVFTERSPPRSRRRERLGQAEFLGRQLVVRLEAEPGPSRVLLHEILHLYGGVHVADDVQSLMNPEGDARALDPLNARIVHELRARRFTGDRETDVFEAIDLEATTRAYEDALRANLALRRAGMAEALQIAAASPIEARRTALRVRELDPHLGDVASFVAGLLLRGDKPASAAILLETAARLYGPRAARGQQAAAEAERIWQQILRGHGSGR